jgi:hypothetical protein
MKPHHFPSAALALALIAPAAFSEEAKKDGPYTGHTEIRLGPITVGVSADVTKSESQKHPYLGVVLSQLSPQLCAQLNLPEGMGLGVDAVSKDSPAEKAGIKRYDVLKKFNDQLLCSDDQLHTLVKAAGAGAKASLVVIRGGKEQNVDIVISERADAEPGRTSFTINGNPGLSFDGKIELAESGGIQDKLKGAREKMNGAQDQQAEIQKHVNDAVRQAEEAARKYGEAAREHGAQSGVGGGVQMYSFYPEEHHSSHNSVVITDGDGTVEISETNGHGNLKITDPSGAIISSLSFTGKLDLNTVPEKFRAKVKDAEERMRAAGGRKPEVRGQKPEASNQ